MNHGELWMLLGGGNMWHKSRLAEIIEKDAIAELENLPSPPAQNLSEAIKWEFVRPAYIVYDESPSGEYEVMGIFTDKGLAERYVEKLTPMCRPDRLPVLQEWQLNTPSL
jgi:hypothetical protein